MRAATAIETFTKCSHPENRVPQSTARAHENKEIVYRHKLLSLFRAREVSSTRENAFLLLRTCKLISWNWIPAEASVFDLIGRLLIWCSITAFHFLSMNIRDAFCFYVTFFDLVIKKRFQIWTFWNKICFLFNSIRNWTQKGEDCGKTGYFPRDVPKYQWLKYGRKNSIWNRNRIASCTSFIITQIIQIFCINLKNGHNGKIAEFLIITSGKFIFFNAVYKIWSVPGSPFLWNDELS